MRDELKNFNAFSPAIKNILRRYYGVWMMYSLAGGFLFGVYPIFLRSRGLSLFEINSVLATYFLVLFLTDVPTGAFADALGRRRSFVLGTMLRVIAFTIYFFSHHYWQFLIAESIDGIGTTFGNGAIDAWGVDALDDNGFDGSKDGIFSRVSQITGVGFMISSVVGAYIANIDIAWPWMGGAVGYLISASVGVRMMTGEHRHQAHLDLLGLPRMIIRRTVEGFGVGFRNRAVLMLSMAGALQFAAWAPYWMQWPILMNRSYGVGVWIIGWIYCVLTGARMIGAEITTRAAIDDSARAMRVSLLVAGASFTLAIAGALEGHANMALAMLFLMNICTGAMTPLTQSWLNEQIEPQQRATMLSFSSTFGTLGGSIGLLASGRIADTVGISTAWQVGGCLSLISVAFYLALRSPTPAIVPQTAK